MWASVLKKCNNGRKYLMEHGDIVVKRLEFLQKMNIKTKETPHRSVFYLDETWLSHNHTQEYIPMGT